MNCVRYKNCFEKSQLKKKRGKNKGKTCLKTCLKRHKQKNYFASKFKCELVYELKEESEQIKNLEVDSCKNSIKIK